MANARTALLIGLMMLFIVPVNAQFREAVPGAPSASRVYGPTSGAGFVLGKIFNPSVFRMSHGLEFNAGSFGGAGYSVGMYTNTMQWQFSEKFAARMDVSMAYSPMNRAASAYGIDQQQRPQVFLRNAEVEWRPSDRVRFNLRVQQDPYARYSHGYYGSPYGGYSPYMVRDPRMYRDYHEARESVFWRERRR